MTTMEADRLVDDYMSRLEEAAAHLQRSRRTELIAEIREHIGAALREEAAAGEVAVRNVLERLGPPEEIVEAAEPPAAAGRAPAGKLEVAAMVTLVVPFIGLLFGIAMVLISQGGGRTARRLWEWRSPCCLQTSGRPLTSLLTPSPSARLLAGVGLRVHSRRPGADNEVSRHESDSKETDQRRQVLNGRPKAHRGCNGEDEDQNFKSSPNSLGSRLPLIHLGRQSAIDQKRSNAVYQS